MLKSVAAAALMLTAGTAYGQEAGWHYRATLYGWLPALTTTVDTRFGPVEVEQSGSDVLSALDMAFMGSFSAQNDRLGFVADLLYADLEGSTDALAPLHDNAALGVKLTALSGYALYRLTDDPQLQFDLGVGFRTFDVSVDTSVTGGLRPDEQATNGNKWTDPLIAARMIIPMNEKWFVNAFADFGGTGADDQTYQIYAGLGYNFNEAWSMQAGYRNMSLTNTLEGRDLTLDLSGMLLAVS